MNNLIDLGLDIKENIAVVSSRKLSQKFGRNHKHVLETIRELTKPTSGLSEEFIIHNFIVSPYKDSTGRNLPEYLLTKDGFVMVVMEFKTAKARKFKEAYIIAFNKMENFIREKLSSEWQETRIKGKLARRNETDIIMTKLIPLAQLQGSKNAGKLYMTAN